MKKLLFTVFLLALSLPSVGQTVQSRAVYTNGPVFNTTSPVPISFQGWTATGTVSKMLVYVDYQQVYATSTPTAGVQLTLPLGQHVVTVQFWDGQAWTKSQWTLNIIDPLTLSPTNATIQCGTQQQFKVTAADPSYLPVVWSIGGAPAGVNPGTIDQHGLYTAPACDALTTTANQLASITRVMR